MDDNASPEDAPPPMESESGATSVADSIPTAAPPTTGVGLGQGALSQHDEKTMGLLSRILGAVTCFVGPLIIWLIKKDESPFVDDQGNETLNFQITMAIAFIVGAVLMAVCVGYLIYAAAFAVSLVFGILGGIEANKGKAYRYPFALRLVK